jgi:hypothetical protein
MTTTQKIIFTPAAPQATTASASQNRVTDGNIGSFDRQSALLASVQESQKLADAHAAGAHTPKVLSTSELRELYEGALINLEQTAAERDRLRSKVAGLEHAFSDLAKAHDIIDAERDQAREQVKTLLTACKLSIAFIADISFINYPNATPAWDALKSAIKAVESEGQ